MTRRLTTLLATIIAVGAGLVTLFGYFLDVPLLGTLRGLLVGWAALLAGVAVWVGAINLLLVHSKKLTTQAPGWLYSIFVILGLLGVVAVNVLAPFIPEIGTGPSNAANQWIFQSLQITLGTALAGMVFFFLVLAGYRLLRRRLSVVTVTFVIVAVVSLVVLTPWPPEIPNPVLGVGSEGGTLRDLLRALTLVPALAGARGLLLGIALGVVATGLRVLLALDRPYGE